MSTYTYDPGTAFGVATDLRDLAAMNRAAGTLPDGVLCDLAYGEVSRRAERVRRRWFPTVARLVAFASTVYAVEHSGDLREVWHPVRN